MAEVIIYQVGEQHFRFSTRIHRWHPHVFHGVNDASIERKTSQHLTKIIIDPWNHHLTYLSPCESLKISQNFPGTRAPSTRDTRDTRGTRRPHLWTCTSASLSHGSPADSSGKCWCLRHAEVWNQRPPQWNLRNRRMPKGDSAKGRRKMGGTSNLRC